MWVNFKLMTAVSVGQFKIVVDIIPWPAYEDGESADLTGIIQATMANAEH